MKQEIKEEMPEWLKTVERYDDPEIDDPAEIWGLKSIDRRFAAGIS